MTLRRMRAPSNERLRRPPMSDPNRVSPETATSKQPNGANTRQAPVALQSICKFLRTKVLAFLEEDHADNKPLRSLQGHVRVAMEVIVEALRRYG